MADVEFQRRTREDIAARVRSAQTQVDNAVDETAAAVNAGTIDAAALVHLCLAQQALVSALERASAPSAPLEAGRD